MNLRILLLLIPILLSLGVNQSIQAAENSAETAEASATFDVNDFGDGSDANPGNGICATSGGLCTLRAAIEETNALNGTDTVNVPGGVYMLNDPLTITDNLNLNGDPDNPTVLDGQSSTNVMHIETIELLVCDSGNNSIGSYDLHGNRNVDFVGSGGGGMDIPGSIAVDGRVFVGGYSSGVHIFERDGSPDGLLADPDDFVTLNPTDLIFGPSAVGFDLLVTDYYPGNRVLRIDPFTGDASIFVSAGSGGLEQPNSLAYHDGDLFVTSATSNEVLRYDGGTGAYKSTFASLGLDRPRGLIFHDGKLLVASEKTNAIVEYDASDGDYQGNFIDPGVGGLDAPTDLTIGPDGNLYVISKGNKSILKFDAETGAFIETFITGGDIFLENPACLKWRKGAGEGPIVYLSHLTLRNGRSEVSGHTAGLHVDNGAYVTFSHGRILNNESSTFGGGVQNAGSLTIRDSEIAGNSLPEGGGGQTSSGGGIFNWNNLTVERTLIYNNFATRGGGINNNGGKVYLIDSTVSANSAMGGGGGIRNVGDSAVFNITHSTITLNRANEPGTDEGEPYTWGGGILNLAGGQVNISHSILAENTDNRFDYMADYSPDCYSIEPFRFTSHRSNIVGILTANCDMRDTTWGDTRFDDVGSAENPLDPMLDSLKYNGADIRSHALLPGSPAIDEATSVTSSPISDCTATDQRGVVRPLDGDIDGDADCDIGAFEYQPPEDGDGVGAAVENGAPNNGDGNNDGIPDSQQPGVTSLPATNGTYITLVAPDGSTLNNVVANTVPAGGPDMGYPIGQVAFEVANLTPGDSAEVQLILPRSIRSDSFYQFGPTPDDNSDHWYPFLLNDPPTNLGALVTRDRLILYMQDGELGDHDLSANGTIHSNGMPAVELQLIHMPMVTRP